MVGFKMAGSLHYYYCYYNYSYYINPTGMSGLVTMTETIAHLCMRLFWNT